MDVKVASETIQYFHTDTGNLTYVTVIQQELLANQI